MSCSLADTVLFHQGIAQCQITLMNGFDKTQRNPFPRVGNAQLNFGCL